MYNKLVLEKNANEFRQNYGIGSGDPIRLKSLLSKLNVITVFKSLSASFSGMALKISSENNGVERFILVNSSHNIGKQHFTICHELYHLYVQKEFESMICNTGTFSKTNIEEFNADVFASYLLLPEVGLKSLIPDEEMGKDKISLKTILKIEQYYSCSRTALLYRLKELHLLSSNGYDKFSSHIILGAIQNGYSTDLYRLGNEKLVIGNYGELARDLFENEKISETHYIKLLLDLGMNNLELDELFNGTEN